MVPHNGLFQGYIPPMGDSAIWGKMFDSTPLGQQEFTEDYGKFTNVYKRAIPGHCKTIRESVDSLCRDGTDAQYMQYLSKSWYHTMGYSKGIRTPLWVTVLSWAKCLAGVYRGLWEIYKHLQDGMEQCSR